MQNSVPAIFEATVTHLSQQGFALIKSPQGQTLFVRGVWPGDFGRFEQSEEIRYGYGFARPRDPQTFDHDARRIICYGFQLREVQPLDRI
jgi:hypothetical protein